MKLLAYLRAKYPNAPSVKSLKRAIDEGRCLVNGKIERFSTYIVKPGDRVEIELILEKKEKIPKPEILYEDDDLIIFDKPSGLECEPRNFPQLHLVHRLDKMTSGVLIVAKNVKTREALEQLFEEREVHKQYLAIVDGVVKEKEGKIDNFLAVKSSFSGQKIWGRTQPGKGKRAITYWKRLKVGKACTLVLCEPLTGRTHQLRVHLSEMGHPILGDILYAKKFICQDKPKRLLLHASKISFIHPWTKKNITIEAPIPKEFA